MLQPSLSQRRRERARGVVNGSQKHHGTVIQPCLVHNRSRPSLRRTAAPLQRAARRPTAWVRESEVNTPKSILVSPNGCRCLCCERAPHSLQNLLPQSTRLSFRRRSLLLFHQLLLFIAGLSVERLSTSIHSSTVQPSVCSASSKSAKTYAHRTEPPAS